MYRLTVLTFTLAIIASVFPPALAFEINAKRNSSGT
jgi:hypothetical protein